MFRKGKMMVALVILLVLAVAVPMGLGAQQALAQAEIPEGATIDSATLWVYVHNPGGAEIYVHPVTASWEETVVTWNNFGSSYDPTAIGSFMADSEGWRDVDVTALVQDWVDDPSSNFGILLRQEGTTLSAFWSSEYGTVELRPYLEIRYSTGGSETIITIQRPGGEQDGVADAYIQANNPDINYGSANELATSSASTEPCGNIQSVIKFLFTLIPDGPGTGTPGYWKNHPEAWPVDEITIGGETYTKEEAISIMWANKSKDKTYTMFAALVCAKLNVELGNPSSCVDDTIIDADNWMEENGPVGSGVKAGGKNSPWRQGEPLYEKLDDYNNGLLCAPHRD